MNLVILKLGGSIITDKKSKVPKVDYSNLNRIAKEIKEAYNPERAKLIIIHGAGSYGHNIVEKTGIHKGIENGEQLLAFAETQRLQNELNIIVTETLIDKGLPAIPCQASSVAVMKEGRLSRFEIDAIKGFLEIGLIPVLYGVPAFDEKQKCSILSGDQISSYLAKRLRASRVIHTTDVDGIFMGDPKLDSKAKIIPEITTKNFDDVIKYVSGSTSTDVTGGTLGKLRELLEVANYGVESQVINAMVPKNVERALHGERIGTIIRK